MALVAVVLLGAVATIFWQVGGGPSVPQEQHYLDLETGRIFVDQRQLPPVASPEGSQRTGVRAHIFGCGGCPEVNFAGMTPTEVEAEGAFVHHLETMADWAIEAIERAEEADELSPEQEEQLWTAEEEGRLVVLAEHLEQDRWLEEGSNEAQVTVFESLERRCPGPEQPRRCRP